MAVVSSYGVNVHTMKSFERIEANVSKDRINRIACLDERIQHVFGDEGRYTIEQDDTNGQIFLKVIGQSDEVISLSIVTQSGKTQDLMLKPKKGLIDPIIIKSLAPLSQKTQIISDDSYHSTRTHHQSIETNFSIILKKTIQGHLPQITEDMLLLIEKRTQTPCVNMSFERAFLSDPYVCFVYRIQNHTKTTLSLKAKDFYENLDEALCLSKETLAVFESCYLYVIKKDVSFKSKDCHV